jgi:hypothetical protein
MDVMGGKIAINLKEICTKVEKEENVHTAKGLEAH